MTPEKKTDRLTGLGAPSQREILNKNILAGLPRARAPYSWNMVNLFLFGCHVTERTYASTDCTGRVGETIKRKGGVSQACLGKSTSFILDIHNMVN